MMGQLDRGESLLHIDTSAGMSSSLWKAFQVPNDVLMSFLLRAVARRHAAVVRNAGIRLDIWGVDQQLEHLQVSSFANLVQDGVTIVVLQGRIKRLPRKEIAQGLDVAKTTCVVDRSVAIVVWDVHDRHCHIHQTSSGVSITHEHGLMQVCGRDDLLLDVIVELTELGETMDLQHVSILARHMEERVALLVAEARIHIFFCGFHQIRDYFLLASHTSKVERSVAILVLHVDIDVGTIGLDEVLDQIHLA
mmetsp:Transcript_18850/g.52402  ORF Transcript_18850/g.52402 Transcript_18850/m.52402 type:complete len:249 (+) Transcript_18850:255-1001(+)